MDKRILIGLLLLFGIKASSQSNCPYSGYVNNLGIGIVEVIVAEPENFMLFNDSLLTQPFLQWNTTNENVPTPNVAACPLYFKPDYGILHYICLRNLQNTYEVMINADQVKYIAKGKKCVFYNWNDYLNSLFRVKPKAVNAPLFADTLKQVNTIKIDNINATFCVDAVYGSWLKLQLDCDTEAGEEALPCSDMLKICGSNTAWLRWRKDNELLIEAIFFP